MRRSFAGCALALAWLAAAPAWSQSAPALAQPPAAGPAADAALAEKVEVARQVWAVFLGALDMKGRAVEKLSVHEADACAQVRHPRCPELFGAAVAEEAEAELARLHLALARELAAKLTLPQLRAGLVFVSDPKLRAAAAAYARNAEDKAASAEIDAAVARFDRTPEGKAFGQAMDEVDINVVGADFMVRSPENILRRLREKAAAQPGR